MGSRKGTLSPNLMEKRLIAPTIEAIKKMRDIWAESMKKDE